jgi:hypothetical protein
VRWNTVSWAASGAISPELGGDVAQEAVPAQVDRGRDAAETGSDRPSLIEPSIRRAA